MTACGTKANSDLHISLCPLIELLMNMQKDKHIKPKHDGHLVGSQLHTTTLAEVTSVPLTHRGGFLTCRRSLLSPKLFQFGAVGDPSWFQYGCDDLCSNMFGLDLCPMIHGLPQSVYTPIFGLKWQLDSHFTDLSWLGLVWPNKGVLLLLPKGQMPFEWKWSSK